MTKINCTAPGCKKAFEAKEAWLPANEALKQANGGRHVAPDDFVKFALCGYHGHLLRKEGIRVYRYLDSVERTKAAEARRQTEELSFKPFAARFKVPQGLKKQVEKGPRRPPKSARPDGDVGRGLARCAEADVEKRRAAEQKAEPSESQ